MSEHLLTVCEALGSISLTPQKRGGGRRDREGERKGRRWQGEKKEGTEGKRKKEENLR